MSSRDSDTKLFDFINDLSHGKKDVMTEENEKDFSPYMVNRFLSMDITTILYANEMNMNSHLTKRMQYDYFLHSIKKHKRFFKYIKHKRQDDIDLIAEYHGCSELRAKEMLPIFTDEDISYMKSRLDKGGVKNDKQKNRR
jgi:Bacteriophage clamp loader A subunit